MHRKCVFAFVVITLTLGSTAAAEYKTKSVFDENYRCISAEDGGFNHTADGHKLAHFGDRSEFFITHISRIPTKALSILLPSDVAVSLAGHEDNLRKAVEARWMTQTKYTDKFIVEKGSFFIRTPEQDPLKLSSYMLHQCTAYKTSAGDSIACFVEDTRRSFVFDIKTKRFSYSYLGTWDQNVKDKYHGDSSVFAFGSCKRYYD